MEPSSLTFFCLATASTACRGTRRVVGTRGHGRRDARRPARGPNGGPEWLECTQCQLARSSSGTLPSVFCSGRFEEAHLVAMRQWTRIVGMSSSMDGVKLSSHLTASDEHRKIRSSQTVLGSLGRVHLRRCRTAQDGEASSPLLLSSFVLSSAGSALRLRFHDLCL